MNLGWVPGLLLAAVLLVAAGAADGEEAEPWLAPAFSATAETMLAAAGAVQAPPGADVLMLYQDVEVSVDGEHRVTYRRRWVYRVLAPAGLESWSVSEAGWLPWHQEQPRIRARVLTPRGPIWVDPSVFRSVPEAAGPSSEPGDDRRVLRATLPEVSVGAVVEEEIVVRDHRPRFAAGVSRRELLVLPVPIRRGRLVLEAPAELKLRHLVRWPARPGAPSPAVDAERQDAAGRVRWTFRYRDMPAAAPVAAGLPAVRVRYPHVAWSTGEDWRQIAAAYSDLVDRRIAGTDARRLLPELVDSSAGAQTERMAEILASVRARLRYEPVAFGAGSVVPATPRTILEHGSADAKDLAMLVVALLRAENIPAYVALSSSGPGRDVEPSLPGLGMFDHALVFLPAGRPIWIDPADRFSRVGELSSARQNRRALVASSTTRGLVRTPAPVPEDNRTLTRVGVELAAEDGAAHIVETSEYHGEPERNQRLLAASLDAASRRRGYLDYVRAAYHASDLGAVEETEADDLSVPYRLRLEALEASRGFTAGDEAAVAIQLQGLLGQLPAELLGGGGPPRGDDFYFPAPFVAELSYRISPPPGMVPSELPADDVIKLADAGSLARTVRVDGGVVIVDLRLESGPARLSAAQLTAYRARLQALLSEQPLVLWFERAH
ncbi:MAG: DUF3857 domain-containing protein [Thermoanaerobaculia bacterium]